jgi:hypothetical protein
VVGVVLISAALAADLPLGDGGPSPASEPPSREDLVSAAQESLSDEESRILEAQASFAEELDTDPNQVALFIISLTDPVEITEIIDSTSAMKVGSVYIWMQAPGSDFPIVGELDMSTDPSADELRSQVADYLTRRLESLKADTDGSHDGQLEEVEAMLADVTSGRLLVHGFRCECSPQAIDAYEGAAILAVESAETSETSLPIPIANPKRDALLGAAP